MSLILHKPYSTRFSLVFFLVPFLFFAPIVFGAPIFLYILLTGLCFCAPIRRRITLSFDFPIIAFFGTCLISLLFRGFPISESIRILQFFGGSLFVVMVLIRTSFPFFYFRLAFVVLTLVEFVSLVFLKVPPFFTNIYFARTDIDHASRSISAFVGLSRLYGPCFNSSVTGSILAVFCFCWLFDRHSFFYGAPRFFYNKYISFLSFITCLVLLVSCQSGTAFLVFLIGISVYFLTKFFRLFYSFFKFRSFFLSRFLLASLAFLSFFSLLTFRVFPMLFQRISFDYISIIYTVKLSQSSFWLDSFSSLLFGTTDFYDFILGGDFLFMNFLQAFGLPLVFCFSFIIFRLLYLSMSVSFSNTRASNYTVLCLPLFMLLLASFHYGAFFALYAQLICASFIVPRPCWVISN